MNPYRVIRIFLQQVELLLPVAFVAGVLYLALSQ
jgi:hypothetical protein